MKIVVYHERVLGFVLSRGRDGFEIFDIDERSLGVFADESKAVAALMNGGAHKTQKT